MSTLIDLLVPQEYRTNKIRTTTEPESNTTPTSRTPQGNTRNLLLLHHNPLRHPRPPDLQPLLALPPSSHLRLPPLPPTNKLNQPLEWCLRLGRAKAHPESFTAKLQIPWFLSDIHRFRDPWIAFSCWGQEAHEKCPALVAAGCIVHFRDFVLGHV